MRLKYLSLLLLCCQSFCAFSRGNIQSSSDREVNVVIVADLHFDYVKEDPHQHRHTKAINRLSSNFKFTNEMGFSNESYLSGVDAVIAAGDIFDKARKDILQNFRNHYESHHRGDDRTLQCDFYPGFGNHDFNPNKEDTLGQDIHRPFLLNYLDSSINAGVRKGKILNVDPISRSYSFQIAGVHFIQAHTFAGDTILGAASLQWFEDDLKQYASDDRPVVFVQHYGVDKWSQQWWPKSCRNQLFKLLKRYNLVAFFAGHTHRASLEEYRGIPVYQVNNAWEDGSGNGSFAVLQIKNNEVKVSSCKWVDDDGGFEAIPPYLFQKID